MFPPLAIRIPEFEKASVKVSVPLWTLTVPLLLNVVEIVEVAALPLLVKVPRLFTTAVVPVSVPPSCWVKMLSPLLVVWSLNVAPLRDRQNAGATDRLPPFRSIWTYVPVAVLVPPSCSVRPPSSENPSC